SRAIAEVVVDSLSLHILVDEPERSHISVFRVLSAPRDARAGSFQLLHQGQGVYDIQPVEGTALDGPGSVTVGSPFRLGDVALVLDEQLRTHPEGRLVITIQPFDAAVRELRREFVVEQADGGAQLLRVRARHQDSVRAAQIPNVATRYFIEYRNQLTQADASNAVHFLREQLANHSELLRNAEERLREFRERARVVDPAEQASQQVQHLADLLARRDMLTRERDA